MTQQHPLADIPSARYTLEVAFDDSDLAAITRFVHLYHKHFMCWESGVEPSEDARVTARAIRAYRIPVPAEVPDDATIPLACVTVETTRSGYVERVVGVFERGEERWAVGGSADDLP